MGFSALPVPTQHACPSSTKAKWFAQDLRAVNEDVIPVHPIVPNPSTTLAQVPGEANHFTALDLKGASFRLPLRLTPSTVHTGAHEP